MIAADLIGREEELAKLTVLLQSGEPATVVVDGPPGIGRHHLLRAACRQVPGWRLLPPTEMGLYVEPRTTAKGFVQRLRTALQDEPEVGPELDDSELADWLAGFGPAVLLLERYRPRSDTDAWFSNRLMPALAARGAPLVLAVLDVPEDGSRLTDTAAEYVELDELSADAVRPGLTEIAQAASPPVGEEELAVYVTAVAKQPGLIDPISRLLQIPLESHGAPGDVA